jgi:hypothetical protein
MHKASQIFFMNVETLRIFERIEKQREKITDQILNLPTERYAINTRGGWSIAQILTHLLISEQISLSYMKKKSLGIDKLEDTGWYEEIKLYALKISQRLPLKYKAPPIVLKLTPSPFSQQEVLLQWATSRLDLKKFLETIETKNVHKKIYKHPVGGMLNVNQAIIFFGEHIHHHLPQIKRLL